MRARNPRTGEEDFEFALPEKAQLDQLFAETRAAQPEWEARAADERAAVLRALAHDVRDDEALFEALSVDTGRRSESKLEVDLVARMLERWADRLVAEPSPISRPSTSLPSVRIHPRQRPYPLIAVISPWNFPLLLSMIDTVPALAAGAAVVVKPSEVTPRFAFELARLIQGQPALRSVLRMVVGNGQTGAALVDRADLVCLTGSVATGRLVAQRCAERLIPAYLELGGKDAAIVTASADIRRAARAVVWASTVNAGQSCLSIERILVHASVAAEFTEALVDQASRLRFAHPDPDSGQLGPIISAQQADVIEAHLADAYRRGARARCGGELITLDGGIYCPATVLADVHPEMRVLREETFGPLMPVLPYDTTEDAIALANETEFGLSGAVFAGDEAEGMAIAEALDVGAVSIGDAGLTALLHDAEKHAFKASGLGPSRMGAAGLSRFYRRQALLAQTSTADDPWWFA